jgi:hypothetical protein
MVPLFPEQDLTESFYDLDDLDSFGTAGVAADAGGADPNRFGIEEFVLQAELGITNDLVGKDIHLRDRRTAGGAFPALIASQQALAAEFFNFENKRIPDFFLRNGGSHLILSPFTGHIRLGIFSLKSPRNRSQLTTI